MRFPYCDRVKLCEPVLIFEELEERIVLDATIDSSNQDHPFASINTNSDWNLEYGSNPAVAMAPMLDTGALSGYDGTLSPVTLTVNNVVAPINGGATVVGLGNLIKIQNTGPLPTTPVVVSLVVPPGGGWSELDLTSVGGAAVSGAPGTIVSIQGFDTAVTATLATLVGHVNSGFNGQTQINVTGFDTDAATADPLSSGVSLAFFDGANDIPFIAAPSAEIVSQNTQVAIPGVSVTDVDSGILHLMRATVTAGTGIINFSNTSALASLTHPPVGTPGTWTFTGYPGAINQTLAALLYTGTQAGLDTITIAVNDLGNTGGPFPGTSTPETGTATIAVTVTGSAINVSPSLVLPPSDTFSGATTHNFGAVWPDPAHIVSATTADLLDVSILVHHGQLGFSAPLPSSVSTLISDVDTSGDSQIYLRGPVAALNSSLDTLTYKAYQGFTGADIMTLSVMDNMLHDGTRNPVQRLGEGSVPITVT